MPFLGNAAKQGDARVGVASSTPDWNGTVVAGSTRTLGPVRSVGFGSVTVLALVNAASVVLPQAVALEYEVRTGQWRTLDTITLVAGTLFRQTYPLAAKRVRLRLVGAVVGDVPFDQVSLFLRGVGS